MAVQQLARAVEVPDEIVGRIVDEHRACQRAQVTTLEHAINAGNQLRVVRMQLQHGSREWRLFIDRLPFSLRTAQLYMQAADLYANHPGEFGRLEGSGIVATIAAVNKRVNPPVPSLGVETDGDPDIPLTERYVLTLEQLAALADRDPAQVRDWLERRHVHPIVDAQ